MKNSTEVATNSQPINQTFDFEGHPVRVFVKDAAPWFVAVDLCKALNLKNSRTALKALSDDEKGVSSTYTLGGEQKIAVVSEGGMWTLVLRCRDAVIAGTAPYRVRRWVTNEVLPSIRKTGVYERAAFAVNPGDVLTADEAETLRLMLKSSADRLPKDQQGAFMMKGWSKLKSHFKVTYREIPRHEYSEAVSIAARHVSEWEVVDGDDGPSGKMTLADCADKTKVSSFLVAARKRVARQLAQIDKQISDWEVVDDEAKSLLPEAQQREITERLNRVSCMFHPNSTQFADMIGIGRALRGLHPRLGMREQGWKQLIPQIGMDGAAG